ncbi:cytochrome c [Flavobacterium flavipallidum]|uniref:Cytochrome c n=1 Tax=Flavobacterium flavipallidum TaxID=3139140 RepID=A0ABU9HMC1_9FLAO
MKKIILLIIVTILIILYSCDSNTYQDIEQDPAATTQDNSGSTGSTSGSSSGRTSGSTSGSTTTSNVTYTTDVKPIITNNCVSCHFSGGESPALTTYTQVKNATSGGSLLCSIQAQGCKVMPRSGKMSQINIDLILLWKTQGYIQ